MWSVCATGNYFFKQTSNFLTTFCGIFFFFAQAEWLFLFFCRRQTSLKSLEPTPEQCKWVNEALHKKIYACLSRRVCIWSRRRAGPPTKKRGSDAGRRESIWSRDANNNILFFHILPHVRSKRGMPCDMSNTTAVGQD